MSDTYGFPDEMKNAGVNSGQEEDNLVMDLGAIDETKSDFEVLPAGVYPCIIENAEYKMSQSSGNPMIAWVFKVVHPEYENRLLFYHTVLNKESGLKRLKKLLMRVCPDVNLSTFQPKSFCDQGTALGRMCGVKIRVKNDQGERKNDVTDVLAPVVQNDAFLGI